MAEDEVSIKGPGGIEAAAKGSQTTNVLLALAVGAWVWYVNYNQDAKAADRDRSNQVAIEKVAEAIKKQTEAIERVQERQEAQIWILSRPQKERERLELARPRIIYEMQRQ